MGQRHDRRDVEVADGNPEAFEEADDADVGGHDIERHLLGGLAKGGRHDIDIRGLCGAAGKAHLAAVMAVAGGPFRQNDPGLAVVAGMDEHEHAGGTSATTGCRRPSRTRVETAHDDRHQHVGRCRKLIRQARQPLDDVVERHRTPAVARCSAVSERAVS